MQVHTISLIEYNSDYNNIKTGTNTVGTPSRYETRIRSHDHYLMAVVASVRGRPLIHSERYRSMITNEVSDGLAGILRTAIVELVRRDGPDLSARQLGVFLTCYLETEAQTVRGLAAKLGVSKPAITRALDRLVRVRPGAPQDRSAGSPQRAGAAHRNGHGVPAGDADNPSRCRFDPADHGRAGASTCARKRARESYPLESRAAAVRGPAAPGCFALVRTLCRRRSKGCGHARSLG